MQNQFWLSTGISYTIISHLELAGEIAFLQLINKSWQAHAPAQSRHSSHPKTKGTKEVPPHLSPHLSRQDSQEDGTKPALMETGTLHDTSTGSPGVWAQHIAQPRS